MSISNSCLTNPAAQEPLDPTLLANLRGFTSHISNDQNLFIIGGMRENLIVDHVL